MTASSISKPVTLAERVSIRRADWRFLLPRPANGAFDQLVLLGGSDGLADRLVEVGLARQVSRSIPDRRSADAVVVLRDAQVSVQQAASCLAWGGSFYYEVDRRQPWAAALTPGRVRRAATAAGLAPTGSYWAAPNLVNCKRYIPLDVPGALRWYLSSLFISGTPLHHLIQLGVRALTRGNGGGFAAFAPCFAVTATAGNRWQAAPPSVLGHPELPAELRQPALRPLVLTSGQDEGSRLVVLPFAPNGEQPLAVIKLATLPVFNSNTEREQVMLADLRAQLTPELQPSIPRPISLLHYNDLAVGVESCAPGHTMVASSGRWRAPLAQKLDDLRAAADWLAQFHQQTELARPAWDAAAIEQWVEQPLQAYARAFTLTAQETQLFASIRAQAAELAGSSLPVVWQHNDLGPWNLYRSADVFTVIDWESGAESEQGRYGPPLCDLIYFLTHWSYVARQRYGETAELQGFRELFAQPAADQLCQAAQQAISTYMQRLNVDQRFVPILLTYTWVRRALDRFDRQRALGKDAASARDGNRYVKYVGILSEQAYQ